jgi:predicted Zn-dependent protease
VADPWELELMITDGVPTDTVDAVRSAVAWLGASVVVSAHPAIATTGRVSAEPLVQSLTTQPGTALRLLLCTADGRAAGRNYVFGLAAPGAAVVFLARLGDGPLSALRAQSVSLHELGHAAGLSHCQAPCVMRPTRIIADLDERPSTFCDHCARARVSRPQIRARLPLSP